VAVAMLILFSLAALAVVSALLWKEWQCIEYHRHRAFSGLWRALGNLWDRVTSGARNRLYRLLSRFHITGPAFNIADSAIVVGALLLLSEIFLTPQEEKPQEEKWQPNKINHAPSALC